MGSAEQLTLAAEVRTSEAAPPRAERLARGVRLALVIGARQVLTIVGCLVVWALLPSLLGMTASTVMSDSMAPGIRAGDVVVSAPVHGSDPRVAVGRVLLVGDPDTSGRLRLHRLVEERGGVLVLKGDANPRVDTATVQREDVLAVGFLRVPLVGLPVLWARTGQAVPLLLLLVASGVLFLLATPPTAGRRARRRRPRFRRGPRVVRAGAVAGAVSLVALATCVGAVQHPASAVFSKTTVNATNTLRTLAYDCPSRGGADYPTPSLYYSYMGYIGNASSGSESDLSGNGFRGYLNSSTTRAVGTCSSGSSPYVSLANSNQFVYQALPAGGVTAPARFGVSTWFRTSNPGGKLIGFGNKGAGTSTVYDRHVYMSNDGRLSFGVQTDQGRTSCTSLGSFADGAWHLVVATYSDGALTLWTDDGATACTAAAPGVISSYTGVWQFGNDTLSPALWTNAPSRMNFLGDLDESAVYDGSLTAANERAVFAVGH